MTHNQSDLSIIIVNYNAGQHLVACIKSIISFNASIYISDNGSTDNSLQLVQQSFPGSDKLHIIKNASNLGFSRGNNIVLSKINTEFILFLNPDCVVEANAIERVMTELRKNPKAGMAGCLIRNNDGSIQPTCVRGMPTPWNSLIRVLHLNKWLGQSRFFRGVDVAKVDLPKQTTAVVAISGAFMLVRRQALLEIGPLDENYFLYVEDLDWMMRFQQAGWQILFVPDAQIVHAKGICGQARPFMVLWHKHKGMMRFYQKFFRQKYSLFMMSLVYIGIWSRFLILINIEIIRLLFSFFLSSPKKDRPRVLH